MTGNKIEKKLEQLISKEKGSWLEDAQFRIDNRKWLKRSQAVAITIIRTLRSEGINQKDFAARLGISAQQVNKWLKGRQNFTFETIAKIEEALNIELMSVVGDNIYKAIEKEDVSRHKHAPYRTESTSVHSEQGELVREPDLPLKRNGKKI